MGKPEIFPNPTVKQVIFQIRFPHLLYIENKIGDFQLKIMNEFPESAVVYRRVVAWADLGPEIKLEDVERQLEKEPRGEKIWQFKSPKNFQFSVTSGSLDITSDYHKTYNLGDKDKFRDVIIFVLDNFLSLISLPIINRIGLRYVDECPVPSTDRKTFGSYYNSVFPLERFALDDADEMDFKAVVKRGRCYIRYVESLRKLGNKCKLILDFDGFALQIVPKDYLTITDELHEIIFNEWQLTIKEPLKEYMRKPGVS
jgi:uncharacterized protein (TIGR04255 family)